MAMRRDIVGPTMDGQPLIPQLELINSVALIKVSGPMMNNVGLWDYFFAGAYDYQWLADLHNQAVESGASDILIEWDSPGGSVIGGTELKAQLDASPVPITHFTRGTLASMALRLSLSGDTFATPTAIVGSIGCIAVYYDTNASAKMQGIEAIVFTSNGEGEPSPLKGTGTPGSEITQPQREFIQARVHEAAAEFRADVLRSRPGATGDSMRGGWVYGTQAAKDNLITGTVPNLETLITALLS